MNTKVIKYLVTEGDGTTHLPYTGDDGKPDHRLMGAAWAALHGGYRGEKYAGPNKTQAISKLTAIYKSEGMDTPAVGGGKSGRLETGRQMRMEVKGISEDGSFEGLLSVYNVVDLGKELVEPGAFTKTIQEHGNEIPLLWQHRQDMPVGKLTLSDGPDALQVKGQLLMDLPEAQKAYLLIKSGIVRGLSIGFKAVKEAYVSGVRTLKELRLFEGSIVTIPECEQALILSVKALAADGADEDFNSELAELQLQSMGESMFSALRSVLGSLPFSRGMDRDQKITAAGDMLQQFTDAYLAYLPAYLDWLAEEYGAVETWNQKRLETKSGRMISAANKETIQTACEHMKSAGDLLTALIAEEAAEDDPYDPSGTSEAKAAETKPEPDLLHSAISSKIDEIKGALQWNLSNRN